MEIQKKKLECWKNLECQGKILYLSKNWKFGNNLEILEKIRNLENIWKFGKIQKFWKYGKKYVKLKLNIELENWRSKVENEKNRIEHRN